MPNSAVARQEFDAPATSNNNNMPYEVHGRVMVASGREVACRATEITLEAIKVVANVATQAGEAVVCFLDNIGILLGRVTSLTERGFVVALHLPEFRRGPVAARLEWHARRNARTAELRAAPRIVPMYRNVTVRLGTDIVLQGEIRNISRTGAAISLKSTVPFIGGRVQIGSHYATVVRHFEGGIAVQFSEPFAAEDFGEQVKV